MYITRRSASKSSSGIRTLPQKVNKTELRMYFYEFEAIFQFFGASRDMEAPTRKSCQKGLKKLWGACPILGPFGANVSILEPKKKG